MTVTYLATIIALAIGVAIGWLVSRSISFMKFDETFDFHQYQTQMALSGPIKTFLYTPSLAATSTRRALAPPNLTIAKQASPTNRSTRIAGVCFSRWLIDSKFTLARARVLNSWTL